jgi:hypothetical protein
MSTISRRDVLTSAAGVGAVALTAGAAPAAGLDEPDPIFGAIADQAAARQAWQNAIDAAPEGEDLSDEMMDAFCDKHAEAAWAMLDVEATTIAGIAALLTHVSEHKRAGHVWPERALYDGEPGCRFEGVRFEEDAIRWAAAGLERLAGNHRHA